MATVSYEVCDRCNNRIEKKRGLQSKARLKKRKLLWWRLTSGAVSVWERELCGDCTEALEKFLEPAKKAADKRD
jgi:tRNA U54 and U55 pseudouridine synthase Pus10